MNGTNRRHFLKALFAIVPVAKAPWSWGRDSWPIVSNDSVHRLRPGSECIGTDFLRTDESLTNGWVPVIKVIGVGVGGAGCNVAEHMISLGAQGVEFVCLDADAQALKTSRASTKLHLGAGLDAGGCPEAGRRMAEAHRDQIVAMLRGAHMAFITTGMGDGTGTGVAPFIAKAAHEMGILTVAIVTEPFELEGERISLATQGIHELAQHVDSLITVPNEKLAGLLGRDVSVLEVFHAADDLLRNVIGEIAAIITAPGLVNVDFEDVRMVMSEKGKVVIGSSSAAGVDRARFAAEQATTGSPHGDIRIDRARSILVCITASRSLGMKEVKDVMNIIRSQAAANATIIFGTAADDAMNGNLRVTVVATGINASDVSTKAMTTDESC